MTQLESHSPSSRRSRREAERTGAQPVIQQPQAFQQPQNRQQPQDFQQPQTRAAARADRQAAPAAAPQPVTRRAAQARTTQQPPGPQQGRAAQPRAAAQPRTGSQPRTAAQPRTTAQPRTGQQPRTAPQGRTAQPVRPGQRPAAPNGRAPDTAPTRTGRATAAPVRPTRGEPATGRYDVGSAPRSRAAARGGSGGGRPGLPGLPPTGPGGPQPGSRAAALQAEPAPFEGPRRGSHSTPIGQGFSWVVGWTILGAVLPGSGLIAAGMRRAGTAVLAVLGLLLVALAGLALLGDPVQRWAGIAVDPTKLVVVAVVAALAGLLWIAMVLFTTAKLRRFSLLTQGQRIFTAVVVTALVVGIALPAYKVSSYAMIQRDLVTSVFGANTSNGPAPTAGAADPWAKIPRLNVLLIGSDAGTGRTGTRPDSLILASIDTKSGNTVLFSLPRNLERVPFPEGTPGAEQFPDGFYCENDQCLLNAVWQWGEQNRSRFPDDPNPGLTATEQAVQGTLGLKPDYHVMLNLQGFEDFVDAIGGVTVDVHERLPIGGNSKNRRAEGWIEAGQDKKLDGFNALWFARSRWTTDDYDRMRRQRCVIGAAASQADPAKLALGFPKIAAATKKNLGTDIPQQDLQSWVTLGLRVQKGKVSSLPFTDKVIPDRADPDFDKIQDYVQKAITPKAKATPSASSSAQASGGSPGSSTGGTKPKTSRERAEAAESADPTEAQDVKSVC